MATPKHTSGESDRIDDVSDTRWEKLSSLHSLSFHISFTPHNQNAYISSSANENTVWCEP